MLMFYGQGLRHAVDADHIAAIDNVTRKLMDRRPVAVGFFFALGHCAVVLIVIMVVARIAHVLGRLQTLRDLGETIGGCVSTLFLFLIGVINILVFCPFTGVIGVCEPVTTWLNNISTRR